MADGKSEHMLDLSKGLEPDRFGHFSDHVTEDNFETCLLFGSLACKG